ncbi:MAG: DUF192 domain-containing protein [Deltaproteobacteria bacterium]|nr:DUF192 domain-containing protein [Deltaproteobacteria bacterium]
MARRVIIALLLLVSACRDTQAADGGKAPAIPAAPGRPEYRWARVWVVTKGGDLPVRVEVAENDRQRTHGLMFKEKLADDEGMVFLFDRTEVLNFWMRNTPLPLDMIFLGDDRRVVGVYENATPFSEARMSVGKPSRYVLEVNAGWARRHGVGPGTQVRFDGVER